MSPNAPNEFEAFFRSSADSIEELCSLRNLIISGYALLSRDLSGPLNTGGSHACGMLLYRRGSSDKRMSARVNQ